MLTYWEPGKLEKLSQSTEGSPPLDMTLQRSAAKKLIQENHCKISSKTSCEDPAWL